MIDAGFSSHQDRRQTIYRPGIVSVRVRGLVPERQSHASHSARRQARRRTELHVADSPLRPGHDDLRPGSHSIRAGVQQNWDRRVAYDANATSATDQTVARLRDRHEHRRQVLANLNADLGVFAQDS